MGQCVRIGGSALGFQFGSGAVLLDFSSDRGQFKI
jgi:hypothetical protein